MISKSRAQNNKKKNNPFRLPGLKILLLSTLFAGTTAYADLPNIKLCAFTLLGESDPTYQPLLDYAAAALEWGAKVEVKSYTNEQVVAEELKAGACDMATMTSLQAAAFNRFTSTVDAPGGVPSYKHFKMLLQVLSKPSAAKYMKSGDYETVGIIPAGMVFFFTNDRNIASLADLAGKKMSTLESMPEMREMVTDMGMTPVSSTVSNVFQKFNNGAVDITAGPAIVYDMMELEKGLEPNGGILKLPLIHVTLQMIARWDKLPEGFAQKSREYGLNNLESALKIIYAAEAGIPEKWWFDLDEKQTIEANAQMKRIRLTFRDNGTYDAKALKLLRQIRCKVDASRAECTSANAE